FTGAAWFVDCGCRNTLDGTAFSFTCAAPAGVLGDAGARLRSVAIGGGTVEAHGENSEGAPAELVAVAVTNSPAGSVGTSSVNVPVPVGSVFAWVVPRNCAPSPFDEASQAGLTKRSMSYVCPPTPVVIEPSIVVAPTFVTAGKFWKPSASGLSFG